MLKRLLFVALMLLASVAQAAVYSLPWGPKPQFVDANGAPMSNGTLSTFLATSSTPQVTYTDQSGGVANPTTITLNVRGETPNEVWLTGGISYKFVLKDSSGSTVWTVDNVSGVNDVTSALSEWVAGPTPTYVSATSFTLAGDQTTTFTIGRRVKTTNSGGTVYSTITNSVFGASTTVTVVNDSGNLDSGLSAVSYGLLAATNPSVPALRNTGNITQALTDGATVNWNMANGQVATWTMAGSRTLNAPTNIRTGERYVLVITQDGTGGRAVTWNSVFKNAAGSMPQPNPAASAVTVFTFTSPDGTNLRLENEPGMVLLATATASASSSIDFTNLGTAGFSSYMVIGDAVAPATNAVNLLLRFSQGGVFDSTASDYTHEQWRFTSAATAVSGQAGGGGGTGIPINSIGATLGNAANQAISFVAHISGMQNGAFKRVNIQGEYLDASPAYLHVVGGGTFVKNSSDTDGIRFIMDSGNIASGTFKLYGIR